MFKTARFKVHNPSRHKSTMLWHALTCYHLALKSVLEKMIALPDLANKASKPDAKGKLRPDKYALAKLVRQHVSKTTGLASLLLVIAVALRPFPAD